MWMDMETHTEGSEVLLSDVFLCLRREKQKQTLKFNKMMKKLQRTGQGALLFGKITVSLFHLWKTFT